MSAQPTDSATATAQLVAAHHALVVSDDVSAAEIEALALSRYPRAMWESLNMLRLTRHSAIHGPFEVEERVYRSLGIDRAFTQLYIVECPKDRSEPPFAAGGGDRDGISRAFPDGLPYREEGRIVEWLVAVARRLQGALRIAGSGAILQPDPLASVDLFVHSDLWLNPQASLTTVRSVLVHAELAPTAYHWKGPVIGMVPPEGTEGLSDEERWGVHAAADAYDVATLAGEQTIEVYGIDVDLGLDGGLSVEIGGNSEPPKVLNNVDWAQGGVVTYSVQWNPPDDVQLFREAPTPEHVASRRHVIPVVGAVAAALHSQCGGEITDIDGFLVSAADL